MRAISLWQPWASAVALGAKSIETRHWSTTYRGPLAIHAAKTWNRELAYLVNTEPFRAALRQGAHIHYPRSVLPFGAVVCICTLADCIRTEDATGIDVVHTVPTCAATWTERQMGNYAPGRFAWILRDIQPLKKPIPWKGGQSFFQVDDSAILEAMA